MQTRFFLSDGRSIYAPYLSDAERVVLKTALDKGELKLFCACSKDAPLYYGISSDLRVIPLHKHYEHKTWCSRFDTSRRNSAAEYDEDGKVTLYVSFKPHTFTMSVPASGQLLPDLEGIGELYEEPVREQEQEGTVEEKEKAEKKPPSFNLYNMVRFINHDVYMNRVASGKYPYLSEDYFLSAFRAYLKSVRISGMDKSLGEMSLKEDRMKFFYVKPEEFTEKSIAYKNFDGRMIHRFVPLNVMAKAEEAFEKKYGITVMDCMDICPVMAAGFQYSRLNRHGTEYKCVGRMVFFPVTKFSQFADSLLEVDVVNTLMEVCRKHKLLFLYSEDDKGSYAGIIRNQETGKEVPVFYNRKAKGYTGDCFSCRGMVPSEEELEAFLPILAEEAL